MLEYSPSDGYRSLREKLVTYYEQYQIKLSPEEIIVTTGGSEAVLFAFMSCLNPGDEIIVPEPAYANYMAFAISAGAVIRPVVASIENGFALPPIEEFEKLINDRTRGILICNPNNPTGTLLQKSQLIPILDCCLQNGIRVILDECFCDMTSEAQQASLLASCTAYPNVFFLKSLTKRFAIPGLRLGYGVCADTALIKKVRQTGQPWSVNTLAAAAGIAALQDTAYQQQFQTFLEQEQPAFYHALQAIPTLQVWKPAANFVFFRAACTDLQERLLHRHILIRHCENYVGLDATYYRTAIRSHAENQILLQALKACL